MRCLTRFTTLFVAVLLSAGVAHSAIPALPSQTGQATTVPRIVSTVPAATLNLVLIGAADRLAGVSKYDLQYLPPAQKDLPIVGDYETMNYEQLIKLKPSALVIQTDVPRIPPRLKDLAAQQHIELVNMRFDHVDDIWASVRQLGKVSGKEEAAEKAIAGAQADLKELAQVYKNAAHPRVLYLVSPKLMLLCGGGTFLDEMITAAGGDNVGAKAGNGFLEIGRETMIKLAPDVLLIGAMEESGVVENDPRLAPWLDLPVPAARAKRVYLVTDGKSLMASVEIGKNVRALARLIHQGDPAAPGGRTTPPAGAGGTGTGGTGGRSVTAALTRGQFFKTTVAWAAIAGVVFAVSMCVSGKLGTRGIEWTWPWRVLHVELRGHHVLGPPLENDDDFETFNVLEYRYPRVVAAALVGFALAAAGVTLQALLRNPLADPYVLGISSGSTVGVMAWMLVSVLLLPAAPPGASLALLAIGRSVPAVVGAVLTCVAVFLLARSRWSGQGGAGLSPVTLLLVGVVVSSINGALLMVLNSLAPGGLKANLVNFMLGSIAEGELTPALLMVAAGVLLVGFLPVLLAAQALNVGTFSDTEALSLGVHVQRLRTLCFICASVMTAAAILLSGPIGFVGLICPHICRRLKWIGGADHRQLLISAPLCGAAFLMLADSGVRVAETLKHGVFPVGVVTALCGGPFFLLLLRRTGGGRPL